ncbi:50S ribosomal protein L11 methyltransferase [Rhizobium sp. S152]|uniref:class I SAM-dependent methyltransferase n=1 Tax=Rhizobium sp. S152 TaxID=3055038 RepID=UPI0025A9F142|nr:50S ribosomal protein L11 methyltransferase [Rhizobium sp. S152]MDM9628082.1 50S ribosomal protein L11 methyltransferase [Rhizobium sp. S152]
MRRRPSTPCSTATASAPIPLDEAPASRDHRVAATQAFIAANLRLLPAPGIPDIRLYTAHAASRLSRLGRSADTPPYWAYNWAGGTVLARHILQNPGIVQGRRVLDLGSGSGIVAIAAAKCGAAEVTAVDVDPDAIAAIGLNATANGVAIRAVQTDLLSAEPLSVNVVLAGDVFYDAALAGTMLPFLQACREKGMEVLIGDPRRTPLPIGQLNLVAEYAVPDFGHGTGEIIGGVFGIEP